MVVLGKPIGAYTTEYGYIAVTPRPFREEAQNSRCFWRVKAGAVLASRGACAVIASQLGKPRLQQCSVLIVYYVGSRKDKRYNPSDQPNALGACKALIDGLVDAQVMFNDSAKHLVQTHCWLVHEPSRADRVELHIFKEASECYRCYRDLLSPGDESEA